MNKRRVSIRGKGAEILFGVPPVVEMKPRTSEPKAAGRGSPELETSAPRSLTGPQMVETWTLDDADLEEALLEEARSGAPVPEEDDEALPVGDLGWEPMPDVEQEVSHEAMASRELSETVAEDPLPMLEVTVEEDRMDEDFLDLAPGETTSGVLPPRTGPMYAGDEEHTSADVQAPVEGVGWLELPERALTEEEKEFLLSSLGGARIRELDEQVDQMYDQVLAKVGVNEQISTECYNQLLKARDILLRRDLAKIPQAEYYVEQVRARLKRADESESSARKAQWWILGWGLLWCTVFLSLLLLFNQTWFRALVAPSGAGTPLVNVVVFLSAAVWGGVGGVVAILYSLFKHVGQRDFDSQYSISYIGKPFLGLILGATVYMIFNLLVRALGIWPAGMAGTTETLAIAPGVIYLMAWVSGFKENRIFDLVDRVMKRLFSGGSELEPAAGDLVEPSD